jgi:hypothetical protein
MAYPFVYPKYFPCLCVTETDSDPKDIRITDDGLQPYPVGMTLEQAMALVWRPREFQIESSGVIGSDCSGLFCSYRTGSISGTSDDSDDQAKLTKMSDLICLENYIPEYSLIGQSNAYIDCYGDPQPPYEITAYLGIYINKWPLVGFDFPIYLFEKKYYVAMFYGAGLTTGNLNDSQGKTLNAGNFTIKIKGVDDITFPIYVQGATGTCNQSTQTATFTMTKERQTK